MSSFARKRLIDLSANCNKNVKENGNDTNGYKSQCGNMS